MKNKKFITDIDYNKSAKSCPSCSLECEKMNIRMNKRKLSEIKKIEAPHILKVFDF